MIDTLLFLVVGVRLLVLGLPLLLDCVDGVPLVLLWLVPALLVPYF